MIGGINYSLWDWNTNEDQRDEWDRAWQALCDHWGSYNDCNPVSGECWQYMGSHREEDYLGRGDFAGRIVHTFRHRDRPAKDGRPAGRVYWKVSASQEWAKVCRRAESDWCLERIAEQVEEAKVEAMLREAGDL
jgi:hypothetical protein